MKLHVLTRPARAAFFAAALLTSRLPAADPPPPAPATELRTLLQEALFEEEATRDLEKAAAGYEKLLTNWDGQRRFAASALFRLAEVRRKQNRKEDAIKLYQRLLTEFPDQDPQTRLSRENLTALGVKDAVPATAVAAPAVSDEEATALARVQKLAAESPDLLIKGEVNIACEKGWLSVVKFLQARGVKAGPDSMDKAARAGHLAVCQELLAHAPGPELPTAGVRAAVNSHRLAVLKFLLENGASPNGPADSTFVPLAMALDQEHQDTVDLLLAHKANVNPSGADRSPLFIAAARGNAAAVQRLLALGADPKWRRPASKYPTGPSSRPSTDAERITSEGSTSLHAASLCNSLECAGFLIKAGTDVNTANVLGYTPLHVAAQRSAALIEFFLAAGANPDGASGTLPKDLPPPLWSAVAAENIPGVTALLKGKANPNVLANGYTPASLAVTLPHEKARDEILALLFAHGADPAAGAHSAIQNAPAPLKIKLLRSYRYPKLAEKPEVTIVVGDEDRETVLAPRQKPEAKPGPLSTLLLAWHDRGGWQNNLQFTPDWSAVRLFRKGEGGKLTETVIPIKAGAEFPALQWGDVIEVVSKILQPQPSDPFASPQGAINATSALPPDTLVLLRDSQTARVKLTAGGVTRDLTLRGSLRTWNPLVKEAPLVSLAVLVKWCSVGSGRETTVRVRLHRASDSGGGDGSYLSTDRTLVSLMPRDGDEVTVMDPEESKGPGPPLSESPRPRIGFHSPQRQFGGRIVSTKGDNTLFQLLAELYAAPPAGTWPADAFNADGTPANPATLASKLADPSLRFQVLPHPDFSRIVVVQFDERKVYNLVEAAAGLPANATAADARKHDVVLHDPCHVEIPVLADAAGKPFTALPEPVERLLGLAVSCRVNIDDQKGDLRAVEAEWLPARYVQTSAGLLPVPAPRKEDSVRRLPSITAPALVASLFKDKYATGRVRRANAFLKSYEAGWLRDGDQITLTNPRDTESGQPDRAPLPANTTRIP